MVADPEAEAQHGLDLTHKTSGFVRYTNGAITPEDTASVKAAKIQHHTLKVGLDRTYKFAGHILPDRTKTGPNFFSTFKAALTDNKKTPVTYAVNPFHQVYQPQVYGLHHQQQFVRPSVYGLHRQHQIFADPRVYGLHHQRQFVAPQVFGVHQQHQQVLPGTGGPYLMPAARHFGKRDAKAALYAQPMPLKYCQPHVYGFQHQQLIQVPRVGVYGHHVYNPVSMAYLPFAISVNARLRLNRRLKQRLKLNTTGLNTMVNTTVPLPAPTLSPVILTLQLTPLDTPPPTTPLILLDIPASTTPLLLDIPAPTTLV